MYIARSGPNIFEAWSFRSRGGTPFARISAAIAALLLAGCGVLPAAGPSTRAVVSGSGSMLPEGAIRVVEFNGDVARSLIAEDRAIPFSEALGDGVPAGSVVGKGDVLDVTVWEAPPAALFGLATSGANSLERANLQVSRSNTLVEQMVGDDGTIQVPFAGVVAASGRTTGAIAADIRGRLVGKANDPQVVVRIARNATANVTVVGEVGTSMRMPLTAKGERVLDALASAGGARQPVEKVTVQVTRGDRVDAMPLEAVIRDPRQNIRLQPDDIVTILFQPYSFTVLGSAGKNEEIPFEATGFTLAQALGRMGGLAENRANPRGVFIFRFEQPGLRASAEGPVAVTPDGKIPVIYRVDMKDPRTFFLAQSFPVRDKDVIYISHAPLTEFSKFLQAVSQIVYPIATIQNTNIF